LLDCTLVWGDAVDEDGPESTSVIGTQGNGSLDCTLVWGDAVDEDGPESTSVIGTQ
nr:hypothetical protein [Tanacetum cinerariifolium]